MGHFKSNLRDLEFNLFEFLAIDERLGSGPFTELDTDTTRDILRELERLAAGPLAESFADGDRNPPVYDSQTFSVRLPAPLTKSCQALWDGEWYRIWLPTELGGYGAPSTVIWAAAELMLGANPAAYIYMSAGPSFATVAYHNGTAEQKRWAELMIERGWGATMVLTEADAGSDVGAGRARAIQQDDGSWHIEGVKRFITSGDWDLAENIVHFVLARPDGASSGTKGLSLFLVPKFHFDCNTGAIGERNGVFATNLEHKMGIKGSATCELTFGQHGVPAVGHLLGGVHDGIAQMFQIIEFARMMVGTKAIATLSTGYLNALEYAKERLQGPDLTQVLDKSTPRVPITRHPDVRRMLMMQKVYTEGLRALYLYTATFQDTVLAGDGDVALAERVNDLLLPIVKGVGSERAYEMLTHSLQTLGGSGFLQDYPIEQYIRDAKIDSVYEGTTGIQSMDFFFRKIVRDNGVALNFLVAQIQQFVDAETGNGRLKEERTLLSRALVDTQVMVSKLTEYLTASAQDPRSIYKVGQHTVRLLMSCGDLLIGWLLLRQAQVALAALDAGAASRDKAFYEGKIAAAAFFAKNVLPSLSTSRTVIESADNSLMDLDETAF